MVAKLQMGKMEKLKEMRESKIKVWKLKDKNVQEEFQERLKQQIPVTEVGSVEEEWANFKKAFVSTEESVCGRTSTRVKEKETPWWNEEVRKVVREKKTAWREWNRDRTEESKWKYLNSKRRCKKVVEEEKKKSWEEFAQKMEGDVSGSKRMLYGLIRSKRTERTITKLVKKEDGDLLTHPEEIKRRWKEYFDNLLNVNNCTGEIEAIQCEDSTTEDDITMLEVEVAVQKMKMGKATGMDEISIEMIKAAGPLGMQWLYRLLKCVWKHKCVPEDWKKGIIIPVFKKGDKKVCGNYRGITLISQVVKILERILERRMRRKIEEELQEEQYGFRSGRSTVDPIFSMRQLMEKNWEYGKDLVMTFIDIEKAYDSVPREKVWETMVKKRLGREMLEMVQAMYNNCVSRVLTPVGKTEWFRNKTGLRQGSVLSPLLFIMVMDEIVKKTKEAYGDKEMKILLFADDVVIWGKNSKEVQEQLDVLNENIEKYGMKISTDKSKTMVMSRGERQGKGTVKIGSQSLEIVDSFKYLGSELMQNARLDMEISRRVQQSNAFYQSVRKLVWSKEVPRKSKELMYKLYYVPILIYAAESWTLTSRQESRIQASEMKFLRSMIGKTRKDRMRNEDVRNEVGIGKLTERIEKSKLRWFGHVKRMEENRIPRQMLEAKLEGKRPRGRPRTRWIESVKSSIKKRNLDWDKIVEEEWWKERGRWRSAINTPTRQELDKGK